MRFSWSVRPSGKKRGEKALVAPARLLQEVYDRTRYSQEDFLVGGLGNLPLLVHQLAQPRDGLRPPVLVVRIHLHRPSTCELVVCVHHLEKTTAERLLHGKHFAGQASKASSFLVENNLPRDIPPERASSLCEFQTFEQFPDSRAL
jgi:hypothetical protein